MSTRTAITVVGTVVGAYFGYPQLGYVAGSLIGNAVDPQHVAGPQIGEIPAQTSADGVNRPLIWGTTWVYGNVIQQGPVIKIEDESDTGKGGPEQGPGDKVYRTYAVRIAGPIGGLLRVWADNKLVVDVRPGSAMLAESALWLQNKVLYLGGEDQLPDPNLVAIDPDNTHAYRSTSYMVFVLEDLSDRGGSYPQYRWEVASTADLVEVFAPLVLNPWTPSLTGRPVHGTDAGGLMSFQTVVGTPVVAWDDYATAVAGNAARYASVYPTGVEATAAYSQTYIGYGSETNTQINYLPGGATLDDNPRFLYYQLGITTPENYQFDPATCLNFAINFDETPRYAKAMNGYSPVIIKAKDSPSSETGYALGADCTPQGIAYMNYVAILAAQRIPSPPDGMISPIVIEGEAKQLAGIQYADDFTLYQNALGPVLLPDDPNYDNAAFWEAERDKAVAAGTLRADVTGWPHPETSYTRGYIQVTGQPVTLGSIVADIHRRCGIDSSMYDVSELTALVDGYSAAGNYTGADIITELRKVHFFDKSEHDKKLWYPLRGQAVVETLTIDDLTEVPDTSTREQAVEVPKKLNLKYQHAASGYPPVKSTFSSSATDIVTTGETTIETSVVMGEDQAAQTVQKMWKVMRADIGGEMVLSVPVDVGAKFVPGNCIGVSLRGIVTRQRIEQMDFADGVIKLTMRPDRQSAYTSTLTGIPIPPPTLPPSTIVGQTELAILDIAARTETEDDLSWLVAVTGALPPWYGARYRRSLDGGASYTAVQDISIASVMGVITADVSSASEYFTDTTNSVNVILYRSSQSIDAISEVQFLSEGGAFALQKDDGSWEVCQYRDCVEETDGSFTLSTLHRGQLNSGASAHAEGSRFVMLDRPSHIPAESSWINQAITHQAISLGMTADDTTNAFTQVFIGRSQIEWPVASLDLDRDGSTVTGSWAPRHRFGSDDAPIPSINFQGFRVSITDGVDSETFDTLTPSFSRTYASEVTVTVASINRITGAGPITSGIV